jgi:hypothetical protein
MTYGDLLCVGRRDRISRFHLKVVIRVLRENDCDKVDWTFGYSGSGDHMFELSSDNIFRVHMANLHNLESALKESGMPYTLVVNESY